jgi:predicted nucleic acid-binding protein
MLVVVDANRLISALLSKGTVFDVFLSNRSLNKIEFIAPEYLFTEVGRNLGEIVRRSKLSSNEFSEVFQTMKEQIELIPFEEFNTFANDALQAAPHEKDVQYFA